MRNFIKFFLNYYGIKQEKKDKIPRFIKKNTKN